MLESTAFHPLRDERAFLAALAEFDELCLADPGSPEAARFAQVVGLIDAYALAREEAQRQPLGWWRHRPPLAIATAASR